MVGFANRESKHLLFGQGFTVNLLNQPLHGFSNGFVGKINRLNAITRLRAPTILYVVAFYVLVADR